MQRLKQWVSLGLLLLVSWAVVLPALAIAPQSFGYSTVAVQGMQNGSRKDQ
jgi:hypothetical protein